MRKRILLFCDSKWRDLPGVVFVQQHLARHHDVLVVPYNYWQTILPLYMPHVVALNHIQGKRNHMIADLVRRNGGKVAVLFNEGILEFSNKKAIFEAQRDHPLVDVFMCWNDEVGKLLGDKAVVTGCPRFDAYAWYREVVMPRDEFCETYGIDPTEPLIILGDSWPSARFTYQMQSFHETNWKDLGNTSAKEWASPQGFAEGQLRAQDKFRGLAVAMRYLGHNALIKTHPMADLEAWRDWSEATGVPILHNAYAHDVISNADIWVSKLGSLTVAETWLSGGMAIKVEDSYDGGSSADQRGVDNLNATEWSDVVGLIEHYPIMNGPAHPAEEYVEKWLRPDSAAPSSEAVANVIGSLTLEAGDTRGEPDLPKLMEILPQLDAEYRGLDPWGNFGKYATQRDIALFGQRVENIDEDSSYR